MRGKVRENITISQKIKKKKREFKKKKKNVRNGLMIQSLMWLNKSVSIINVMFQILAINIDNEPTKELNNK